MSVIVARPETRDAPVKIKWNRIRPNIGTEDRLEFVVRDKARVVSAQLD